jgi:XTP/dITP diphosphohydrolase
MPEPRIKAVLASGNRGKLEEIRALLAEARVDLVPQSDFGIESPEETGSTFRDNALIKARHASSIAGLPAIADDSGLAVDALEGRPGVRSARYAGAQANDDENIDTLLAELANLADDQRGARFRCVAVFLTCSEDTAPLIGRGEWRGRILEERRGTGGFGYDPVFLDRESGRSAAELTPTEKNGVSHRGRAFRELARLLAARSA